MIWKPGGGTGIAPNLYGFTSKRGPVAQVSRYDRPPAWKAFVRGYPVGAHWKRGAAAQRDAEYELARQAGGEGANG